MPKIALVKILVTSHVFGYGSDYDSTEYYYNMECLDSKDAFDVTDDELQEYVAAVKLYNAKNASKGIAMALIKDTERVERIALLEDLQKWRQAEVRRAENARLQREAELEAKRLQRESAKLKRVAKSLGVTVEELIKLQKGQ